MRYDHTEFAGQRKIEKDPDRSPHVASAAKVGYGGAAALRMPKTRIDPQPDLTRGWDVISVFTGEVAMKRVFVLAASLLMVATWAQAEKTDMSKITCDDVMHSFPEDIIIVGAWMSGYYNAKRNNTVVDEKEVAANSKKVAEFCQGNPKLTLMEAIEQISKAH